MHWFQSLCHIISFTDHEIQNSLSWIIVEYWLWVSKRIFYWQFIMDGFQVPSPLKAQVTKRNYRKSWENCCHKKNITWERHVFNTRIQQPGETINQYVTNLRNIDIDIETPIPDTQDIQVDQGKDVNQPPENQILRCSTRTIRKPVGYDPSNSQTAWTLLRVTYPHH